jgi:hypothetical protein
LPCSKSFNYYARALCLGICSSNGESFQGASVEEEMPSGSKAMYVFMRRSFSEFSVVRGTKK